MGEQPSAKQRVLLIDEGAGERYEYLVQKGREIFGNSSLVNPDTEITPEDLDFISLFHREASPTNPNYPWRVGREEGRNLDKCTLR